MEYFGISAKFVPLKYYTLSSQLRRLTSFSVGCSGRRILSPGQIAVMQKWSINNYSYLINQSGHPINTYLFQDKIIFNRHLKGCNENAKKACVNLNFIPEPCTWDRDRLFKYVNDVTLHANQRRLL